MASAHALDLLQERQCQKIYSALDSGNPRAAIREADKVLSSSSTKSLPLASALKAIALARTSSLSQANSICDDLLSLAQLPPNAFRPLCMALSNLGRAADEVNLLETANKANPSNVELGRKTFLAMSKAGMWYRAQQVALRLHTAVSSSGSSSSKKQEYFWWSVASYVLLAREPNAKGAQLALPLADRMVQRQVESTPLGERSEEELFLQVEIKLKLARLAKSKEEAKELYGKAVELLEVGVGKGLVERNLGLEVKRMELRKEAGMWKAIRDDSRQRLVQKGNRNWLHFSAYVEACLALDLEEEGEGGKKGGEISAIEEADKTLLRMAEGEDASDRGIRLARLLLHSQAIEKGLTHLVKEGDKGRQQERLAELCLAYFNDFHTKACAAEDLLPHLRALDKERRQGFSKEIQTLDPTVNGEVKMRDDKELCTALNATRLRRSLSSSWKDVTSGGSANAFAEAEREYAQRLAEAYYKALPVGSKLPLTEMQPADDFALLSAHASISAWSISTPATSDDDEEGIKDLLRALSLLRSALDKSPKGYRLRFLLVRILVLLADFQGAREEYAKVGIKGVQNDTLGWIALESFFEAGFLSSSSSTTGIERKGKGQSQSATDQSRNETKTLELVRNLNRIYAENDSETRAMLGKAFEHGTYSKVEEFVDFHWRLDHSATRLLLASAVARSALLLPPSSPSLSIPSNSTSPTTTLAQGSNFFSSLDEVEKGRLLTPLRADWGDEVSDQMDAKVLPCSLPEGRQSVERLTAWDGTDEGVKKEAFQIIRFIASLSIGQIPSAPPENINEAALSKQLPQQVLAQYRFLLASFFPDEAATATSAASPASIASSKSKPSLASFIQGQTSRIRSSKGPRAFADVVGSAKVVVETLALLKRHPPRQRSGSEVDYSEQEDEEVKRAKKEMCETLSARSWSGNSRTSTSASASASKEGSKDDVSHIDGLTLEKLDKMVMQVGQRREEACKRLATLLLSF